MKKKLLSILLSLALVLTMIPMTGGTAYATGTWSNLHWEGTTACWDAYEGADYYWIYLYKDGSNPYGSGFGSPDTSINFEDEMLLKGSGTYTFSVVPRIGGVYYDNLASEKSVGYVYTAPELDLSAPVNLRWNGNTAEWDPVEDAMVYTLDLYKDGELVKSGTHNGDDAYVNLTDLMEKYGEGAYTFKVASQGAGKTGDFSAESPVLNYTLIPIPANLHWEGNTAKWDAVPGASQYWIYIYKEGTQVYVGVVYANEYDAATRIGLSGCGEYQFAVAAYVNGGYGRTSDKSAVNDAHLLDHAITPATFTDDGMMVSRCTNTGCAYENTETIPSISSVALSEAGYIYDGTVKNPSVIVKDRAGRELKEEKDYTVSKQDGRVDVGTYTYSVEFKDKYSGAKVLSFTIGARSIEDCSIKLSQASYTYDGTAREPAVTIEGLAEGTDYEISYSGNVDIGTAAVTITGKGNYTGTVTKNFTIGAIPISGYSAVLSQSSYTYDGTAKAPKVTITGLTSGTDYTVTYTDNVNAGTATAVITGKGKYSGTVKKTYVIKAKSISGNKPAIKAASFVYTGKAIKPAVTISGLKSGSDFTAAYKNNIKAGKATITIQGKGNYTGTLTKTFKIVPKQAAVKSLTPGKKKLTVKMTAKPAAKGAATYQIGYMKKGTGTWKYTTTTLASKTIKSLQKGKRYYVKVRAFRTVNKVKYYGAWSKTKLSAKVK